MHSCRDAPMRLRTAVLEHALDDTETDHFVRHGTQERREHALDRLRPKSARQEPVAAIRRRHFCQQEAPGRERKLVLRQCPHQQSHAQSVSQPRSLSHVHSQSHMSTYVRIRRVRDVARRDELGQNYEERRARSYEEPRCELRVLAHGVAQRRRRHRVMESIKQRDALRERYKDASDGWIGVSVRARSETQVAATKRTLVHEQWPERLALQAAEERRDKVELATHVARRCDDRRQRGASANGLLCDRVDRRLQQQDTHTVVSDGTKLQAMKRCVESAPGVLRGRAAARRPLLVASCRRARRLVRRTSRGTRDARRATRLLGRSTHRMTPQEST